ncbi:MAG: metallophosphoesterase family protein [Gaiellaceae bacterium]
MRVLALAAVFLIVLIGGAAPTGAAKAPRAQVILLAAGDIGDCTSDGARQTGRLIASRPGTVAAIGDTAYPYGSSSDFARCYQPAWGSFKARTRPAIGNHEYYSENGAPYFAYFGRKAASPGGYYSYRLGRWHIVALNSNCDKIGGCGAGSVQLRWLKNDLARHPARCTLAYWHHARFSSGMHGSFEPMQPIWATLVKAGADIALTGHDHDYERYAPLNAAGKIDWKHGMREFVVGTGGGPLRPVTGKTVGSRKAIAFRWGVLRLKLGADRAYWRFLSTPNGRVLDSGSSGCH